ncbi:MAG: adenine deaminase, partial [Bdellovibrionales bacterium]|nr:adenine deaminase [Bdellovibrionales bacterium]
MPSLSRRIDAAQGRVPCDMIFRGVTYLDVFSCAWRTGDVAVADGVVVALDAGLRAEREIQAKGKYLVPGFIDAHVHIESSLLVPENFSSAVLPRGTTTAVADPHEIANVIGVEGVRYFLDAAGRVPLDLRVMLPSCVPATDMETNGAGVLGARDLLPFKEQALGLAEMMNVPGVLHGDAGVHEKLCAFSDRPLDGHAPLLRGRELSAYAACGISSCHESSQLSEAEEKISKGISVWIREGSVAKDLHTLLPLMNLATSTSLGFCTDDRNPLDIAREGHIDWLVREAVRGGVPAEVVYRASSWSVARHYGLDRGRARKGAVAPGWCADLVLLQDAATCSIQDVFRAGRSVAEIPSPSAPAHRFPNTVRAASPSPTDLEGSIGQVHVIGVEEGKIITHHLTLPHDAPGVARLSVLERY